MVVMGVGAFILCTGHRSRKTKERQPWNNTKQIFPEEKTKKSFALRHLCPGHELLSGILESINTWTNCQFIWSGKVYIWLSVWEFQKLFLWLIMSQQGHACWELRNWSTSTWLVYGHFLQFHSCMGIFSHACMYTNNCEHFHKWFGSLYRDNSVLMRVLHIQ